MEAFETTFEKIITGTLESVVDMQVLFKSKTFRHPSFIFIVIAIFIFMTQRQLKIERIW